jgi:hypothetical protein
VLPNEAKDTRGKLQVVPSWPSHKTTAVIGQVGGIALDSKGDIVVFHRADRRWESGCVYFSFLFNFYVWQNMNFN